MLLCNKCNFTSSLAGVGLGEHAVSGCMVNVSTPHRRGRPVAYCFVCRRCMVLSDLVREKVRPTSYVLPNAT